MTIFMENKYTRWYFNIINFAISRDYNGYTEKHHIIPKSLGGSNNKDNLVKLTAREHYICHLLLTKMVEGMYKRKMLFALWRMMHGNKEQLRHNVCSRQYTKIKEDMSVSIALQNKTQIPWNKGKKNAQVPWNKGKKGVMSEEAKKKISDFRKSWRKNKMVGIEGLEPPTNRL